MKTCLERSYGKNKFYAISVDFEYMTFNEMEEFMKDIREEFSEYNDFSFDYEIKYDYGYKDF